MHFESDDLTRLARLARLAPTGDLLAAQGRSLDGIFGLIDELKAVDTAGIEPLAHPLEVVLPMAQRLREDAVTEGDDRDGNLANAPASEGGLFLVPRVIE